MEKIIVIEFKTLSVNKIVLHQKRALIFCLESKFDEVIKIASERYDSIYRFEKEHFKDYCLEERSIENCILDYPKYKKVILEAIKHVSDNSTPYIVGIL